MLVNYEEQNTILSCEQEPKDKLIFQCDPTKGKIRVKMLNRLSDGTLDENFVQIDLEVLEQVVRELKEMQ
ncbi:hypothetical protein VPHD51_0048 [Vibrio phage D51]